MEEISKGIIQEAAAGDMKAFEQIYKATSGFVYSTALRIVNNTQEAEEITQEVFIKIYKNMKNFEFRSSLKTWIYRITMNTAINVYRKLAKPRIVSLESQAAQINLTSSLKQQAIEEADGERLLKSLLDKLNADQKSCIILREIEGLSYREIANTLKVNINTVRSRLKRARETLLEQKKVEVIKNELQRNT